VSPTKRRTRRERPARSTAAAPAPAGPGPQQAAPRPAWKWRTFPVYFAFSVALFIGVYAGFLAGYVQGNEGNGTFATVIFIVSALLLGFGLSRITTQFLISRNWIKPRPKKR